MRVRPTTNMDEIKLILCDDVIYSDITSDNATPKEDFTPPMGDNYLYIGGYVKNEIIALMVYYPYLDGSKCHIQVLKKFRRKYGKLFGVESLKFKPTNILYTTIPDKYRHVLIYAKSFGFKIIKTLENWHVKNGEKFNYNLLRLN